MLFDRCDTDTVTVMDTACDQARHLGHDWLGTEHLLLALAHHRDMLPQPVAQLLPSEADVRAALTSHIDTGPPHPKTELLATLGIDLDDVRAAVRDTFGAEAITRLAQRRVHQPWQPWRRPTRDCMSLLAGHTSVAPRVKQALEHALRDAERRSRDTIDPVGLLLGTLEVDGLSNQLLRTIGVSPDEVRAVLD